VPDELLPFLLLAAAPDELLLFGAFAPVPESAEADDSKAEFSDVAELWLPSEEAVGGVEVTYISPFESVNVWLHAVMTGTIISAASSRGLILNYYHFKSIRYL
jgi:hypothetical protein